MSDVSTKNRSFGKRRSHRQNRLHWNNRMGPMGRRTAGKEGNRLASGARSGLARPVALGALLNRQVCI
jgi:hypothetical protein